MKPPKERTWDVWAAFLDGDLQWIYRPGTTKQEIIMNLGVEGEELVKVRVTRL